MAVSFVAASAVVTGANPTLAVPSGYAQGDLLVIVTTGTATPTTPAGWTQSGVQGGTGFITILSKFASGTEASVAVTLVGIASKAVMLAYRGASAIDTVSGFTTATAATSVATGLTGNAFANELEVSIFVSGSTAGTWTAPALTTSRINSSPTSSINGMLIVDETQAAAGNSTSRTGTITGAHTLSAVAFSIIPSGRYWVGGTGTWSTATTNWAFTSGGASGAPAPTINDNVFFDQAGTYTVTLTGALTCFDMTVSASTVTFTSTGTITNSGSMSLVAGTVWSATGLLTFNSTSTGRTVTTNAVTINSPITFDGVGGAWSLGSTLTTGTTVTTTLTNGTLTLNGFNLTTGSFSSNNANTRTIALGANNIVLSHTTAAQTVLDIANVTGLTLSGTGGFTSDASVTRTYVYGTTGSILYQPNLSLTGSGTAVQTFTTGSYFNSLNFGTTAFNLGTTALSLSGNLTLSSGGTFSGLTATLSGTSTVTSNTNTTLGALTISGAGITVTLGDTLTMSATSVFGLGQGTLTLNGFNLTTGRFGSSTIATRSINFGTNNIILAHTTAATTVLGMADVTNFTYTGTGGFISDASITRTYVFGTTSGTSANSPNLSLTGSGTAVQTFTTGSWFGILNFGTTAFNPGTTNLNLDSLVLSSGGTFSGLTATMVASGAIISNTNATLGALTITTGTVLLGDNFSLGPTGTFTLTTGTLDLNGNDLTTGIFSSNNSNTRVITFGSNYIYLVHTTAATTVLNLQNVNFSWTGTGGFSTAMTVTRTFSAGGTPNNSSAGVNLFITSGSSAITFTAGDWYSTLNFTGSTSSATVTGSSVNVTTLVLASGGTYGLNFTTYKTGTLTTNGKSISQLTVGNPAFSLAPAVTTLVGNINCSRLDTGDTGTVTLNFDSYNMTTGIFDYTNGTLSNIATIACTTFTITGPSFAFSSGTITPSTSFVLTSGSFTYNVGATLSPVPTFTHTAGTVTLNQAYALTTAGTYTLVAGTLTLNSNLTTGAFITTGTGTRAIAFGTSQITLTGNNTTIFDGGSTGITYTGTPTIVSNYTGSVGTRTINVGTGWTEATAFDVKAGSAVGISIGTSGTDTVAIAGNLDTLDLTGMLFTYSPGVMTVYVDYTIPVTGGTVSGSANTTTFASTNITPRVITVSRSIDFPITFSGVGGTFNLGDNFTTGVTRTTTLTSGTLALNGYNYSTGLFSSTNSNTRTLAFGTNNITVTGSGAVWSTVNVTNLTITGTPIVNVTNATATATNVSPGPLSEAQSISFNFTAGTYTLTFLDTAGYAAKDVNFTGFAGTLGATGTCTVYGSYTISSGMTVTTTTNTLTFGATSGTKTITTVSKVMPPITINGVGGTFNLGSDITFANTSSSNFSIDGGTFNTNNFNIINLRNFYSYVVPANVRAINLGSSSITLTVSNSNLRFDATNLTLNAGTSTISYTAATSNNFQIDNGSLTFYNLSYASTTSNSIQTIIGTLTFNNLTGPIINSGTSSASFVITNNITVNGTFTLPAGTATLYRCLISSATPGSQVTITAATVSLDSWNFQNINAGGSIPWTGTLLGDVGNNSNITFAAGVNKYWNLPAGGNWFSVAWALTSGGTPSAANYPLPQDTCIIENTGLNTGATISVNNSTIITTLNMSSRTSSMTFNIQTNIKISLTGDWINGSGVSSITGGLGQGIFFINSTGGTQNITSAGKLFTPLITVNTFGTVRLLDNFDQDSLAGLQAFTFTAGTIDLNNFNLSTAQFTSSNSNTRAINFGTGYINLTHTTAGTVVLNMSNAQNFSATGAGGFRAAMSVTRQFDLGDSVSPNGAPTVAPNLFIFSGASIPSFTTGGYYNLLDFTGSTCTPAVTTLKLYSLTLASGGTYTNLTATMIGTGTITGNGKTIASVVCSTGGATTTITGTVVPTALTINGGTVTLPAGAQITNATVTLTSGTFNFNGGTVSAAFTQTAGTVNVTATTTLAATSTYTFTSGTITLTADLTVGIFSSSNTNTRSISFGSNNIILAHTTAAQTVLSMAIATGFTWTSSTYSVGMTTGCFTATMDRTRTFVFGTTGGSITNSPNLYLSSGASIATITTGSWFNELNLGSCSFTIAATSLNLNQFVANGSTCVLTNLTANMRGTGYIYTNNSIGPLVINTAGIVYIYATTVTCTTCTLTTGTFDFYASGTLTCSSTFTFTSGSLINTGTINCTTFTVAGANFTFYNGYLNPSVSFVITSGTFTYGAGSGTMVAVPTFTHTAGTVNFLVAYALTVTGTYTFTAGTLNITPTMTLSTGIFSSSNTNTRAIAFGTFSDTAYIVLTHTTAATVVLNMATLTGFSQTGIGGFQVADMANTRTFTAGTTGGSVTTAPSLFFTTGASVATITTAGWFKDLYFGDTTFNPGTTSLNIAGNLSLGNGVYSAVTIAMRGNGYIWNRYNAIGNSMGALTINTTGVVNPYPGYTLWCTTLTITAGTLDFTNSGGTITCSSTVTYTAGTLTLDSGALNCTTFTVNGAAFTFNGGSLIPSVSFVLTSGSFTYGGTANLNDSVLPLFTHTAGTVTLNKSMSLGSAGASGTYTFTAGTLTLTEGSILTCSIFSSTNANTRTINFGTTRYTPAYYNYPVGSNALPPSYISLTNSTAAQTVLNMAIATGFTWTGSGLFYCPGSNTGTLVFGTTGGSTTNAPNLRLDGGSALTVTTASWFNVFNLVNAGYTTPATSINVVEAFALWSNGTHTGVTIVPQLSATSILNNGNTFGGLTLNVASINIQLIENLLLAGALTLTQGTLTMGTFNVNSATFASTGTATRAILGIGTNTYTLTGAGATAFSNASATGLTMSGFTISMTSASAKTFAGGGGSFPTLNQGGTGALTITGTNTFYNITNTVQPASVTFTAATTTTFRYFSLSGNAGNLVTITSATAANHTLSMSSGVANTQYMSISRSTAQGGAGWIADLSTNGANNAGWVFAAPRFIDMSDITFDTNGGGITFN